MLQVPIELVELHDAIKNSPSQQHIGILLHEFKHSINLGSDGRYIAAIPGKLIWRNHKGDGKITCWYCGKLLDNSLSRIRGAGPVCIRNHGPIPGREHVEIQITKMYLGYVTEQKRVGKKHLGIRKWLDTLQDDDFSKYWKKFVESVDPVTR